MPRLFKFIVRLILIIVIFLFYLKYRNNQCIINQNCKPYFISYALSLKKDFEQEYIVAYKIIDNLVNVDITTESSIDLKKISKILKLKNEEIESVNYFLNKFKVDFGLSDLNIIQNNDIIVKKFSLINTGDLPLKVSPKMTYNDKIFKIYNCFCGSEVIVYPNLTKDIYIYFQIKDLPKEMLEKFKNKSNSSHEDFIITVSI
jgi:hypothetical protein